MKLSEVIAKQVLSLYEAQKVATVLEPELSEDYHKIKSFIVFDDDENEMKVSVGDIYSVEDYVVIKNSSKLKPYYGNSSCIIGKEVLNTDGRTYGKIVDIEFDEKYEVVSIVTDTEILQEFSVLYNGENFVINGKENLQSYKLKPKSNPFKMTTDQNFAVSIQHTQPITKQPIKINGNTEMLIGRIITVDLYGKNNELIAKKNQIINEKIIQNAKLHNKINYLLFNSAI